MVLDTGTMLAIMIALVGSCSMMFLLIQENRKLLKKVRDLQVALRDERRK